uniref:Uncharacterized protein n=1 Tax=Chenopodium quinoa TaxID=63459 RepID=A0A803N9I2_CHEQI
MTSTAAKLRHIMAAVKEKFLNESPNKRHIYNVRSRARLDACEGRDVAHQFVHLANEYNSTGALDTIFRRVHNNIEGMLIEIRHHLEDSRWRMGSQHNIMPLLHLNGFMSFRGLDILQDELKRMRELSDDVLDRCRCALLTTHGLPCARTMWTAILAGTRLYLDQVHPFWKTLVIGEGVDIPVFADESEQDEALFRSLVDEVLDRDPSFVRGNDLNLEEFAYLDKVPAFMLPFLQGWSDPLVDDVAINRITWTGGRCDTDHWMVAFDDLFPIANFYNAAVMCFGVGIDGRGWHFVRLEFEDNFPVPPIATTWFDIRDDTVTGWEDRINIGALLGTL